MDRFNDWYISAFVTASNTRFLLLHDAKNEDGIKSFFHESYEFYLKVCLRSFMSYIAIFNVAPFQTLLNPFYLPDTTITSTLFDSKIKSLVKKHL